MCKEKRTEENSSQKKSGAEEKECKNEDETRTSWDPGLCIITK